MGARWLKISARTVHHQLIVSITLVYKIVVELSVEIVLKVYSLQCVAKREGVPIIRKHKNEDNNGKKIQNHLPLQRTQRGRIIRTHSHKHITEKMDTHNI